MIIDSPALIMLLWRRSVVVAIFGLTVGLLAGTGEASAGRFGTDLASSVAISTQYQERRAAVSPTGLVAVSRPFSHKIGRGLASQAAVDFEPDRPMDISTERSLEISTAQYQPSADESDRRLMLRLGLGLGAAYLVFLVAWVWATRVRGRPPGR
jgi:hypothetical protein